MSIMPLAYINTNDHSHRRNSIIKARTRIHWFWVDSNKRADCHYNDYRDRPVSAVEECIELFTESPLYPTKESAEGRAYDNVEKAMHATVETT